MKNEKIATTPHIFICRKHIFRFPLLTFHFFVVPLQQKVISMIRLTRQLILCLASALLLIGCGENPQEQAVQLARQAATLCEEGRLDEARLLIDSLRRTYPDVVEARKAALRLHQDVELKIAQKELARTDSLLVLANRELEALQRQVDAHKAALTATAEELTNLTRTRMRRDSIRTQFEALGMKIRYIRQKKGESKSEK